MPPALQRVCVQVTYRVDDGRTSTAGPFRGTLHFGGTAIFAPAASQRVQRRHTRLTVHVDFTRLDSDLRHLTKTASGNSRNSACAPAVTLVMRLMINNLASSTRSEEHRLQLRYKLLQINLQLDRKLKCICEPK